MLHRTRIVNRPAADARRRQIVRMLEIIEATAKPLPENLVIDPPRKLSTGLVEFRNKAVDKSEIQD